MAKPNTSPLRAPCGRASRYALVIQYLAKPNTSPLRAPCSRLRRFAPFEPEGLTRPFRQNQKTRLVVGFFNSGGEGGIDSIFSEAKSLTPAGRLAAVCGAGAPFEPEGAHPAFPARIKKPDLQSGFLILAEREGFEPSIGLTLYALSRGAPSATRPPLQKSRA